MLLPYGKMRSVLLAAVSLIVCPFVLAASNEVFAPNNMEAIPSFLIIGTAKGGTTDLFEQLTEASVNQLPSRPDPPVLHSPNKEAGLLSRGGIDHIKMLPQRMQYVEYLRLLMHPCGNATAGTFQECLRTLGTKQFTVDATPTYFFSPVAPLYLRGLTSTSKVIMMIREPVERAEVLFRHLVLAENRWPDTSIDMLTDNFFNYLRTQRGILPALKRLAACKDVLCYSNGWRDLAGMAFLDTNEIKLFAGGLYRYALASWRYHYFTPGRVFLVDSHSYFDRRTAVMEKVIRFLYGRDMLPEERSLAETGSVWRKATTVKLPKLVLSPERRQALTAFYNEHVTQDFFSMLEDMRKDGAWVMGFDAEPWQDFPGFAEFHTRA